jgi:mono/diheme cytochrome c family protein
MVRNVWAGRGRLAGAVLACLVLGAGALVGQDVATPAQSVAAGSRIYGSKGCSGCHAINGIGGTVGPDLAMLAAPSLASLLAGLWNHLPSMAERIAASRTAAPLLEPWEAGDLMAFLFWAAARTPPGDPKAGRDLFAAKGCVVCHRVGDVGGVLGPALDGLRERASTIDLAAVLWNHAPGMDAEVRSRGIARPTLTGREINDLVAFFGATGEGLPQEPVYALSGRPEEGRRLFRAKGCVRCHQAGGEGGAVGPALTAVAPREPADFAAAMWNKGLGMLAAMRAAGVAAPQFTGAEMADVVAYLGTLQYLADEGVAARGGQVMTAGGCTACHGSAATDPMRTATLDTRGAVTAALWNHVGLSADSLRRSLRPLTAPQMADLVAYLESRGRRP